MKHTQPYAAVAPAVVSERAPTASVTVELSGGLVLGPGGEAKVLRIFDDHGELADAFRVDFDGVEPRVRQLELSAAAWPRFRRGLVLCASHAVGGLVTVTHTDGGWRLTVEACGDPPRPVRRTTERLTGQRVRPGPRAPVGPRRG